MAYAQRSCKCYPLTRRRGAELSGDRQQDESGQDSAGGETQPTDTTRTAPRRLATREAVLPLLRLPPLGQVRELARRVLRVVVAARGAAPCSHDRRLVRLARQAWRRRHGLVWSLCV